MAKNGKKYQTVMRRVADLKPHPRQAELFADLPDHELQELAEDIDKHGVKHPLDILPNNVVVGGHQRLRALKLLRKKTARCRILHYLADADEHEVIQYIVNDNLLRRQLTQLEQARLYRELLKLERGDSGRDVDVRGDLRDRLASQFGVSGRTLDRWEKVLDSPREVQDAYSRGQLRLVDAGKVADFPKRVQRQIGKAIRRGANPKEAVEEQLNGEADTDSTPTWGAFKSFLRSLEKNVDRLGAHHKTFDMILVRESDLAILKGCQKLVAGLIRKTEAEFRQREARRKLEQEAKDEAWAAFAGESGQESTTPEA